MGSFFCCIKYEGGIGSEISYIVRLTKSPTLEVNKMAKKSKTSFKKDKKQTKDTNIREEYSKELNQVIHNNPPQEVTSIEEHDLNQTTTYRRQTIL